MPEILLDVKGSLMYTEGIHGIRLKKMLGGKIMWPWKRHSPEMLELVRAALRRWDPIGAMPDADDSPAYHEYDSYAKEIVSILSRGASSVEIASHLGKIRYFRMGSPENPSSDLKAAEDLIKTWQSRSVNRGDAGNPKH